MPKFDKADLLARCQLQAGRPATDGAMTPARWYSFLTDAQDHWTRQIATHFPQVLYGDPVQLQTPDDGETYRLPLDADGLEVFAYGLAEVRERRNGRILTLGPEWKNGVDFTPEGTILRVPHGKTRTFSNGPWMRYVTPPGVINASTEPTLKPVFARILLVYHACWLWASRPPHAADPDAFRALEQRAWMGDPDIAGDYGIVGTLETQFMNQDDSIEDTDGEYWHQSQDFD